jgi:cytochrome c
MFRTALLGIALGASALPALAADGQKVFQFQCKGCHSAESNTSAPTLKGIFGAKIAGRSDFTYSDALAAKTGIWDQTTLDAFLTSPSGFADGTRMPNGLSKGEDRAAVIEFLKSWK